MKKYSPKASLFRIVYYVSFIDEYSWFIALHKNLRCLPPSKFEKPKLRIKVDTRWDIYKCDGIIFFKSFRFIAKGGDYFHHNFFSFFTTIYTRNKMLFLKSSIVQCCRVAWYVESIWFQYEFWSEAVNNALYLINISPFSAINVLLLFELNHKRIGDYRLLRIFDFTIYSFRT